jgi:hypothetical protein
MTSIAFPDESEKVMTISSAIIGSDYGHLLSSSAAICPFRIQITGSHLAYFYRYAGD